MCVNYVTQKNVENIVAIVNDDLLYKLYYYIH